MGETSLAEAYGATRTFSQWSVPQLERHNRNRRGWAIGAASLVSALAGLLLLAVPSSLAVIVPLSLVLPAFLIWLWRAPERGVYVLFAAATVQEVQYAATPYPDDLGHYVPFFQDLTTWTHVGGLAFSLCEIFMLLVVLIWILKGVAERTLRFRQGTLFLPLGLYMLMVLVGEFHGLTSGGDFRLSLWEIRSQVYMFVAYMLTCNLVTSRRALDRILWIIVLGGGIKGVQGVFRLYVSLHGSLHLVESLLDHEQSFFFNAFLTAVPVVLLNGGSTRLKRVMVAFLPFVLIANLANQRRAAILALVLALVVLLLVTAVAIPARRRLITKILLVAAIAFPPYYIYYSGKDGLLAQPAHAISSSINPDTRDALSNLYRVNEDKNIKATMRTSPIIGYGYGKPMLTPYPLADISGAYIFWNILPHDSVLWVWMRLGTIGFLIFWTLIGAAIIQASRLVVGLDDPYLKGWALLILLLVLQEVVFGYLDIQWTNYRNLITIGVLFGLLGTIAGEDAGRRTSVLGHPVEPRQRRSADAA